MGLADLFIQALQNPEQRAATEDVSTIQDKLQSLTGSVGGPQGLDQQLLSTVGSYVRGALQDQRQTQGVDAVHETVQQYSGVEHNDQAVDALFEPKERERVVRSVSEETGLHPNMVQKFLPFLVPMALKLLQGGAQTVSSAPGGMTANPVLRNFLDANRDGEVDLGDVMSLANRFLASQRR